MNRRQVRIAAIGLGNRTCKYLHYVKEHQDVAKLVAIIEPDKARLSAIRELFQLPEAVCFTDVEDFFASDIELDACIIGTPDNFHFDQTHRAMSRGWNVLLEKPMAQTAQECRSIAKAAEETGAIVVSEEHNVIGGLGSAVAEVLVESGKPVPMLRVGVEDTFGRSGPALELLDLYGLTAPHIVEKVKAVLALK